MGFGLELDVSNKKDSSKTTSEGTKTGVQKTAAATDTSSTVNSGRTDTSKSTTRQDQTQTQSTSGRMDTSFTDQTTQQSGRVDVNEVLNSGRRDTGGSSSTQSGRTDRQTTAARQNVTEMSSDTFNSGRTDTQQTILEKEAVDRLIAQIMEGSSGLQAVTAGQRQSGGYNTTAATLLTNDLIARTAGEVAVRGAKTVSTIGASSSSTRGKQIENIAGIDVTNVIGGSRTDNVFENIIGESSSRGTNTIGASSSRVLGGTTNTIGGTTSTSSLSNIGSSEAVNIMGESRSDTTTNVGARQTDVYETESKAVKSDSSTTTKGAKTSSKISIVCTELHATNRLSYYLYYLSAKDFDTYPQHVVAGYYYWAMPILKHLRATPNSIKSKFYCWLLNSRCRGVVGYTYKNPLRWYDRAVAAVTYGICSLLGRTVARKLVFNDTMYIKLLKGE